MMNYQPLTFEKFQPKLGKEDPELEDQDDIDMSDFIVFDYDEFEIVHGFPGDNPIGYILNKESDLLHTFGESIAKYEGNNLKIKQFLSWYHQITNNLGDYDESKTHPIYGET